VTFTLVSSAIELQVDTIKHLRNRSAGSRIAEGTEDADKIVKAFRTMCILCDVFQVSIQINDVATYQLITLIDGHTAEYREHRKCHFAGIVIPSRNTIHANMIFPQHLKSGGLCRSIGLGSAVLTQIQVLSKGFATKRHHTKPAFRPTVMPTAAWRALA
jgi:hypothetical protein